MIKDESTYPIERNYFYTASLADDATFSLPELIISAYGVVFVAIAGVETGVATFTIDSSGSVTLFTASANIVANADTDTKFCLGTSVANPVTIKNRLGLAYDVFLHLIYR